MRRRIAVALLLGVALAAAYAATTLGHPERVTTFPNRHVGKVPSYRTTGPQLVVCRPDSAARIRRSFAGRPALIRARLRLLSHCRYSNLQAAVNRAKTGYRIALMPGLYKELPSRKVPVGAYHQPPCPNDYVTTEGFSNLPPPAGPASNDPPVRPNRNYQVKCPDSKNLVAVIGDTTHEKTPDNPSTPHCLQKCNLQIEGMGRRPTDVVLQGDRRKLDVLRIDRAWGIYLRNFTVEQAAFNGIDIVEVNGFVVKDIVARWNQNYGVLSFTTVHGLYDHDTAYGNGDSGLYPGSTMKGCDVGADGTCDQGNPGSRTGCRAYSVEIRNSNSYGNTLGYSGTAGNSTWVHDNRFHDNASGLTTDSFAAGHPGMPQECFKWEHNQIYSNNNNVFAQSRQKYCMDTPFVKRKKTIVCPQFQTAVGTGILIGGGNRNLFRNNYVYDNWRYGTYQLHVPATLRGENDPAKQNDTSNGNQYIGNHMGTTPGGARRPNGLDFEWDGQGQGNCWHGNTSKSGAAHASNPASLPDCPGSPVVLPGDPTVLAAAAPCTAWDPARQPDPVGCDWFTTPSKPE